MTVFLGRRLYGRWYVSLGCSGLPLAVCDVAVAGDVIAWYAARFEEAPRVLNLMDLRLMTRREVLRAFRERGWNGHVLWIPISLMAGVIVTLKTGLALSRLAWPQQLAAWSVLRPRRFIPDLSSGVLATVAKDRGHAGGLVDCLEPLGTGGTG